MNKLVFVIVGANIAAIIFFVVDASVVTVNAGEVGVLLTWGQSDPNPLSPGLHIVNPISQKVAILNVQTQLSSDANAASSDPKM